MRKRLTGLALVATLGIGLTGCAETFTFEAVPVGVDDDEAETGIEGDPRDIECFDIEADSSSGDDGDVQLGRYCRTDDTDRDEQDEED